MVNQQGVKIIYYPTDYNTDYDVFFGEDMNRHILRRFNLKALFELPEENQEFAQFGIFGLDVFSIYIPILSFETGSKMSWDQTSLSYCSSGSYDPIEPQVGDIIEANYGDHTLYEIINVKKTANRFNLKEHTYEFIVRVFRDDHLSFSEDTSATMTPIISGAVDVPDILGINDVVDDEMDDIEYKPKLGEENNDIFGGW